MEWENIGSKIAGKSDLERFGAPFGKGLGGSGASLGRLLAVFLRFGIELSSSMGPRWALRCLLDRFGVDLGRPEDGFALVWAKIWGLWGTWKHIWSRFCTCSSRFAPAGADSIIGPPRCSAKRHNARGSPSRVVKQNLNVLSKLFRL